MENNKPGKISRIILFDNRQYSLKYGSSVRDVFIPVYKAYHNMLTDLNHLHDTEVFIFFRCNPHCDIPSPWTDPVFKINYIPVNAPRFGPKAFIPTQWVQDVIFYEESYGVPELVCNSNQISQALFKVIKAVFSPLGYKITMSDTDLDAGGNWQAFEAGGKVFRVSGRVRPNKPVPIPSHNALKIELWAPKLNDYIDSFFHLDNYFNWIGPLEGATGYSSDGKTLFYFLASIKKFPGERHSDEMIDKAILAASAPLKTEIKKLNLNPEAIPIPVIRFIIKSEKDNESYQSKTKSPQILTLSYANGLIENYTTAGGLRIVNAYLPDFVPPLLDLYNKAKNHISFIDNNTFIEGIRPLWESLYGTTKTLTEIDKNQLEDMVRYAQHKIATGLYGIGFTNVCFVRHRFDNLALKRGALHCITKIV